MVFSDRQEKSNLPRGGEVWYLTGLITRRPSVQIRPPLPTRIVGKVASPEPPKNRKKSSFRLHLDYKIGTLDVLGFEATLPLHGMSWRGFAA